MVTVTHYTELDLQFNDFKIQFGTYRIHTIYIFTKIKN